MSNVVVAARGDADTLGVLLHGSRASGRARDDSDQTNPSGRQERCRGLD